MTLASKITLLRVAFIPLFMLFMYLGGGTPNIWMWLALAVFIIASITDYVDGHIARKKNQVSDFGKFLDPLADKLLVISAMCIFCEWEMMPAWALMLILAREFSVTGLRLIAVGKGKVIAAGWSGKVKTAVTMVGLCVWMAFPRQEILGIVITIVILIITIYSGIEYFIHNWKCLWD